MDPTTRVLIKTLQLLVKDYEEMAYELKADAEHALSSSITGVYYTKQLDRFNDRMASIKQLEALIEELKS